MNNFFFVEKEYKQLKRKQRREYKANKNLNFFLQRLISRRTDDGNPPWNHLQDLIFVMNHEQVLTNKSTQFSLFWVWRISSQTWLVNSLGKESDIFYLKKVNFHHVNSKVNSV